MSPLVTMVVSLTFKFCWKMLVEKLQELFQATTRSCAGPPVVTQSCLYGPAGIAGYSQTTPGQRRLRIFYLSPGTQRRPRTDKMDIKKEDTELKMLMFLSTCELHVHLITWTSKRMVTFLNKLSSATVFSSSDHSLAADIRGITEVSSSNWTSGKKHGPFPFTTTDSYISYDTSI